jgi:hypothetical protein
MIRPSVIENNDENRRALQLVFSYHADRYDLGAYDQVQQGLGDRVWNLFQQEQDHIANMNELQQKSQRENALSVLRF